MVTAWFLRCSQPVRTWLRCRVASGSCAVLAHPPRTGPIDVATRLPERSFAFVCYVAQKTHLAEVERALESDGVPSDVTSKVPPAVCVCAVTRLNGRVLGHAPPR